MDLVWRKLILLLGDALLLFLTLAATVAIRYGGEGSVLLFLSHAVQFMPLFLVWLVVFYVMDVYDLAVPVTSADYLSRFSTSLAVFFFTGILYFYVVPFPTITPKTNLLILVVMFGALAYLWRRLLTQQTFLTAHWRIVLCGSWSGIDDLRRAIEHYHHHGFEVSLIDSMASLPQAISTARPHVVVARSADLIGGAALFDALENGILFIDPPSAFEMFARRIPVDAVDEDWFIRNVQDRQRGMGQRLKRAFDLVAATGILIVASPILALIALLIKIDDHGSIFYRQERLGKHRAPFSIIKFRTMRVDAEADGAQWAAKEDHRVTRVGKWLRLSHLDELPQMINVLCGEISLVGPRPERPVFVDQLEREIPFYRVRHFVTPGFTGWAQIKFRYARSVTDSKRKFEYDLYYIKNRSVILDALILLKTLQLLFRRET